MTSQEIKTWWSKLPKEWQLIIPQDDPDKLTTLEIDLKDLSVLHYFKT